MFPSGSSFQLLLPSGCTIVLSLIQRIHLFRNGDQYRCFIQLMTVLILLMQEYDTENIFHGAVVTGILSAGDL
jgi:hypothetical protein